MFSVTYSQGISKAWSNIAAFLPKLVAAVIIVAVGYIVAKIIAKVLTKVLQKVRFDDLVERGGVKKALAKSNYDAAAILAKLVYYAIMLFVLSTAFGVFGNNPISDYLKAIIAYLPLIFVAIIIIVVAGAIAAAVKMLVENALGELTYAQLMARMASGAIVVLGVVAALDELRIAATVVNAVLYAALVAIVGVIIVAVGGGGIKTMSERWAKMGAKYDEEMPRMQVQMQSASSLKDQVEAMNAFGSRQDGAYPRT